jgi:hypothetical protein
MLRENCILDCDSPNYGPEPIEYAQCGCRDCRQHLEREGHLPGDIEWAHFRANHRDLYPNPWREFPFKPERQRIR